MTKLRVWVVHHVTQTVNEFSSHAHFNFVSHVFAIVFAIILSNSQPKPIPKNQSVSFSVLFMILLVISIHSPCLHAFLRALIIIFTVVFAIVFTDALLILTEQSSMSSPHDTSEALRPAPRRKGGRPRKAPGAVPEKRKPENELSQHPRSVKRRKRLENQSATDREVERAVQRDCANKNNALKRYLKTGQYLSLSENEKLGARTDFLNQWVEVK